MQPTMKFRWVPWHHKSTEKGPYIFIEDSAPMVLQQWFEGQKIKPEYANFPYVPYDPANGLPNLYEPCGEWRDVPIESEK